MVLSNKKLKQKLRSKLADSILSSSSELSKDSFKSLLHSLTHLPKLSKREKLTAISSIDSQTPENAFLLEVQKKRTREDEDGNDDNDKSLGFEKEGARKKKKRVDKAEGENGGLDGKKMMEKKKKKKKKKKYKKKKSTKDKEVVEKSVEIVNGGDFVVQADKVANSQDIADVSTKVYVGGIPYYSNEEDIRSFFESCGTITEVDCLRFPDTGKFRGIAFITFKTEAAAKRALALDGADMGGLFLKIQPCQTTTEKKVSSFSPAIVEGYNRIYVGNLSWDITEEDLRSFFEGFKVSSIRFGEDKETKEFRGYAHVDFTDSIYVTMALKLDQKILCGRPVRISCAVPAKKADPNAKFVPASKNAENLEVRTDEVDTSAVSGKIRRRTCYECGEKGHLTSSCPKKQAADSTQSLPSIKFGGKVIPDNVEVITIPRKITQTCSECGERGHVTSSCPNTQIGNSTIYAPTNMYVDTYGVNSSTGEAGTVSGKIRRRTCYECGEKGHLSSLCPNKQPAGSTKSVPASNYEHTIAASSYSAPIKRTNVEANNVGDEAYNVGVDTSSVSGKIRRRTCYECGEKGHLSSLCPNKQPADSIKSVPASKNAYTVEATTYEIPVRRLNAEANIVSFEANNVTVDTSTVSGKIRRRTCYECGEKGHLSSLCPKKQSADSVLPIAT